MQTAYLIDINVFSPKKNRSTFPQKLSFFLFSEKNARKIEKMQKKRAIGLLLLQFMQLEWYALFNKMGRRFAPKNT